ncbi:tRNA pseudouridine(38-40) synthase TruA [Spiractinospora alimapuensis]|uniref:tRNA pseudouridine(38-40) synthase TruA n=1 Tax=Spiractinospora alimapuensis TaxID=2820884 RepID=UPI001F4148CB|nr:tRNA pseudouridine(38-40) synthase TruA [Spiractinospora alimapuensis]
MVRLRLDIAYDGAEFSGWAAQPERRTVQGVLEKALARVLRIDRPQLTVAGRTDAGVHARGQVAHVDVPAEVWDAQEGKLTRRLAGVLKPDVRVWSVAAAPAGFDARFSALRRRYVYRVGDAPGGVDPLRRHDVLWHRRPLDLERMNQSTTALVGEHDFAAFCRKREGATTIRELLRLEWREAGPHRYDATVAADAFCHNMVRALVGAMLMVGDGRREPDWPGEVLRAGVRNSGVHVAPAHGLTLEEVTYPGPGDLASRAQETRRVRTLDAP